MSPAIAIVGMSCRYPDARSPSELWENALAQRRAFRHMPPERLRLEDYLSADRSAPDSTYTVEAALIEDYEFDRGDFRVGGSTFRSADLVHWLALDFAAQALTDAGFSKGKGLPRETTGVLLGNTLTGEFSRANAMRLRWPYVQRVVDAILVEEDWPKAQRSAFIERLETQYKAPFPPVGEETLAGALSNTIAGRICSHFKLKGGGYTVDGACASSLLAVDTACSALITGDLDVALAGGVDLSLDPFEIIGFAKAGALASDTMRVYDARSTGFLPGEGCGFVVLMRYEDAVEQSRRIYAVIRGWGISSDGSGGITRPDIDGQLLMLRRAYRQAGFGIESVEYFEGHGTGTKVGDATELQVLSRARREAGLGVPPAAVGSIKANIGHTKAAAGVAGLIKTAMALHTQILPPTTGCEEPHPELTNEGHTLRVLSSGELWPPDRPLRAGVSAMGFGGINTHVVLEGVGTERRKALGLQDRILLYTAQDVELFLIDARDVANLQQRIELLLLLAPGLSQAEMADLAAELERKLDGGHVRAAVVASNPTKLVGCLKTLRSWLLEGIETKLDPSAGVFLGSGVAVPRIGFLFPGQGAPVYLDGGILHRSFEFVQQLYEQADLPREGDEITTAVAQPAIVTASVAAQRVLDRLGVEACLAVGHSLGELTALHWADVLDKDALIRIAAARGKVMAKLGNPTGAMASISAGPQEVKRLLIDESVVIAGFNSPYQTVVSGEATAVDSVANRARAEGLKAVQLPVSHAFHSPLMAMGAPTLAPHLSHEVFGRLQRNIISTVTGAPLMPDEDLRGLLYHQVTSPVRFTEAIAEAEGKVDLWIEVGPGRVLSGLVAEFSDVPVVATDAGGPSLKGLLKAVGAVFATGAPLVHEVLFSERFTRPFDLERSRRFFVNPCELAPVSDALDHLQGHPDVSVPRASEKSIVTAVEPEQSDPIAAGSPEEDILGIVRRLVAERVELPYASVKDDDRLLSDLHLNSITVGELVSEAARHLGLSSPVALTEYADATVAEITQALEEAAYIGGSSPVDGQERVPSGVDSWLRTFTVELVECPLSYRRPSMATGIWRVIAPPDYPLKESLQQAFDQMEWGGGVVVCLPSEPDERYVGLLLEGTRLVLKDHGSARFVIVQHCGGGAAFARTLHLEVPEVTTCVVDVPPDHPKAMEWVTAEAMAAEGYAEVHYDLSGRRLEPVLHLMPVEDEPAEMLLGSDDVLLVTGGGKGIAAECALSLARETGVRLALIGRSRPDTDVELLGNLDRMAAAGITFQYIPVDITDADAVRVTIREAEENLGPITAILHGAARNDPQLLSSLNETAFLRTLMPKVQGARNLLAAIDPNHLRLFVTFGSIIARTGLPGEADYAVANEWLARLTERWQAEHPHCRCVCVEWSVWADVGMGARLGWTDALVRRGITAIPPDKGVSILRSLLSRRLPTVAVVVTGRTGEPPTLKMEQPDAPFLRFLEQRRVYYPGVELVVDAELSTDSDPYLNDHVLQGTHLFPAVMGLEAMAQVVAALTGSSGLPVFENVTFHRPVVVPECASVTIRVAALVCEPNRVDVVLRSAETAFQVDHFQATCRMEESRSGLDSKPLIFSEPRNGADHLLIDSECGLYGSILFHSGRFRRLRGYHWLRMTECIAEIAPVSADDWFGRYLPRELVLGDPGARDAAIHAVQACIPHVTLLPTSVNRFMPGVRPTSTPRFVYAQERSREGDIFTYDLEVVGVDGYVQERWEGLQLRRVADRPPEEEWAEPLLGPYIERQLGELIPGSVVAVAVEREARTERRLRSDRAIQQALGKTVSVRRRPDGKPEIEGDLDVSVAHADDLTLAVVGLGPVGCDVEAVVPRPASKWHDLLGSERFRLVEVVARVEGENQDTAATRVWVASECLKKAGAMVNKPLVLASSTTNSWILLKAGQLVIATFVAPVHGADNRLVLGVLVRSKDAIL